MSPATEITSVASEALTSTLPAEMSVAAFARVGPGGGVQHGDTCGGRDADLAAGGADDDRDDRLLAVRGDRDQTLGV